MTGRYQGRSDSQKWAWTLVAGCVLSMLMGAYFASCVAEARPRPCPESAAAKYPPPVIALERLCAEGCVGPYPAVTRSGMKISAYRCSGEVVVLIPNQLVKEPSS